MATDLITVVARDIYKQDTSRVCVRHQRDKHVRSFPVKDTAGSNARCFALLHASLHALEGPTSIRMCWSGMVGTQFNSTLIHFNTCRLR